NAEAFERALSAALKPSDQAGRPSPAGTTRLTPRPWLAIAAALTVLVAGGVLASRWSAVPTRDSRSSSGAGRGATALAIAAGPKVRDTELPKFVATGEPSRSGRWLPGYDWTTGENNLAVVDPFAGTRRLLTHGPDGPRGSAYAAAISPDEKVVAYSWELP